MTKRAEHKLWISWRYKGKCDRFKQYSSGLREKGLGYLLFTQVVFVNPSNWFLYPLDLGELGNMSSSQSLLQTTIFRVMNTEKTGEEEQSTGEV